MGLGARLGASLRRLPAAHLGCLLVIALELAAGALLHRPNEALWQRWQQGPVAERIDALVALAHRGDGVRIDEAFVRALSREPDERLRAMAMTIAVTKHFLGPPQREQLRSLRETDLRAWCRALLLLSRRTEGVDTVSRREVEWFVDALHGEPGACPLVRRSEAGGPAATGPQPPAAPGRVR